MLKHQIFSTSQLNSTIYEGICGKLFFLNDVEPVRDT